jgi:glyoxylase-like metal-dependent hydrolase (beta-lactamase superfamily II)/rhodanese-related sulfurtransferase
MEISTVVDEGLGNSAHVVDLGDGGALVVDPWRDPRPHLAELTRRHLRPRIVVETHLHADFISGGRELAALGAQLLAPAGSELDFVDRALVDGDVVDLGGLSLEVIATPGHTPEHLSYLLRDGDRPVVLFSGGTLMAGGVARPDLLSPAMTEPLARAAYRSIRERLLVLPDDLPVYPTHGGGSFCASTPGGTGHTTIGQERRDNPLLADDAEEDEFVRRLLASLGSYPPYFLTLRDVNRAGPAVIGPVPPALPGLSVDALADLQGRGAEVVDVRGARAFADGHVPGALSIPWRPQFATWLGWLVDAGREVVIVADDGVDRADLVWAALTIGVERIVGELRGGMPAWIQAGRTVVRTPLVDPAAATGRRIVDVRQQTEFRAGHSPESTNIELGRLRDGLDGVPEGPLLVHCGHGERAMTAASLLQRAGREDVVVLAGGPAALGPLQEGP